MKKILTILLSIILSPFIIILALVGVISDLLLEGIYKICDIDYSKDLFN